MTRATHKPLRRVVQTLYDGDMVVEITDRTLAIRPPRTRHGGRAEVSISWGGLYDKLMLARAEAEAREKQRLRRERRRAKQRARKAGHHV